MTFLRITLFASLFFAPFAVHGLSSGNLAASIVSGFLLWPFAIVALVGAIVGLARIQRPSTRADGTRLILMSSPMIAIALWSLAKGTWS